MEYGSRIPSEADVAIKIAAGAIDLEQDLLQPAAQEQLMQDISSQVKKYATTFEFASSDIPASKRVESLHVDGRNLHNDAPASSSMFLADHASSSRDKLLRVPVSYHVSHVALAGEKGDQNTAPTREREQHERESSLAAQNVAPASCKIDLLQHETQHEHVHHVAFDGRKGGQSAAPTREPKQHEHASSNASRHVTP